MITIDEFNLLKQTIMQKGQLTYIGATETQYIDRLGRTYTKEDNGYEIISLPYKMFVKKSAYEIVEVGGK